MPSSLFNQPQNPQSNPLLNSIRQFKSIVQGGPQGLFDNMMRGDPQFRAFADSVKGKTPEQAFREHGLDFDQIKSLLG